MMDVATDALPGARSADTLPLELALAHQEFEK